MLELFMAHRRELVNYASRIVGDHAHAEDVVQEAYLKFASAAAGQPIGDPLAYLYRIVRNLSVDLRRSLRRESGRLVPDAEEQVGHLPEDRPSPETEAGSRKDLRIIAAALAELPERTRIAIEMHRFGGCSFRVIARQLDISVGLAHSLVIQGLEHCRRRLHRE